MGTFGKVIRGFGGASDTDRRGPVEAVWKGTVIASSDETIVVEGNHYFPPDSVDWDLLRRSDHQTVCPWKGRASYFTIDVEGERNDAAAWTYPDPKPAAGELKDHVAFWRGVEVRPAARD